MKRLLAGVLTVMLMGFLAWTGIRRPASAPGGELGQADASAPANRAEARIQTLLRTAWDGDVSSYLNSFRGPLRQRLEREVNERGRDAFADDLRRAARSRKSHAVFAAEAESTTAARVTVETVYLDRNERQTYRLEAESEGWFVTDVETVRSHQPKAKYGAQASYQEPEGVPVQSEGLSVETGEQDTGRE